MLLCLCSIFKGFFIGYIFIVLHEIVHIIVAYMYNVKLKGFKLHITGANCSFSDYTNLRYTQKIIMYASGPIFNLCIFIIFVLINNFLYTSKIIYDVAFINLFLCIFNILPAFPLDGGRIFEAFLCEKKLYGSARKMVEYISFFMAAIFMILFISTICIHKINFSLFIAFVLITYSTIIEMKKNTFILICSVIHKKDSLFERGYIENKNISVYYKCTLGKAITFLSRSKLNYIYVVDDKLILLKIVNESELLEALKLYGDITFKEYIAMVKNETILKE